MTGINCAWSRIAASVSGRDRSRIRARIGAPAFTGTDLRTLPFRKRPGVRYAAGQKAQTREKIVKEAARAFRAEGIDGVSIATLMGRLGLTHGGFYAHFPTKDALVAEACAAGLAEAGRRLDRAAFSAPGHEIRAIIDRYVAADHRDTPDRGCISPALAGEIGRQPAAVRERFTEVFRAFVAIIDRSMADDTPSDDALALTAGMVGAIMLARAIDDPELSDRMLRTCHDRFAGVFAGQ